MSQALFSLLLCCYSQFVISQMIIQPPQNQSVCEGGTVDFTCIVMFTSGAPSASTWFTDNGNIDAITQPGHTRTDDSNGRPAPANVTTVLTVTNVSIGDNGTDYICVQGINERSDSVFLTVLAFPPMIAPTLNGVLPNASSTSFTINWTISNTDYDVIVILTNLRTKKNYTIEIPQYTVNTNIYSVTEGLNGMDNYNVSVATVNACGMMISDSMTVYDKPDGVNNIQHDSITCESFIIRWDNVSDIFPVTYTVRWYRVDGDDETDITTGISYPVTGLANSTYYNVTVTANNTCCGAGQISDIIMVMTNNVCPSPTIITVTTTTITPDIVTPTVNMTEPPTDTDNDDGSSNGAIIGGVVGGIAGAIIVIIIVIFLVYCCIYRNRDSTDSDKQGLKSPTGTGGSHTASVQPSSQSGIPHQTADSGAEYAVTTKVNTTTKTLYQPTEEYAMVDKNKKHAAATQGITYADLQPMASSGDKPIGNQGPTATYAQVA